MNEFRGILLLYFYDSHDAAVVMMIMMNLSRRAEFISPASANTKCHENSVVNNNNVIKVHQRYFSIRRHSDVVWLANRIACGLVWMEFIPHSVATDDERVSLRRQYKLLIN